MSAIEVDLDEYGVVEVVNETGVEVSAADLKAAFGAAGPMVDQISRWTKDIGRANNKRRGGLIDRDRFLSSSNVFDQIRTARQARSDDIVDGITDLSESLAFKRTAFYADDPDEQAAWNLWAGTVNLDGTLRSIWREYIISSQVPMALWWDTETYRVPGRTENDRARRKTYTLEVPTAITVLDALKVAPVGQLLFGKERLAYIASRTEADVFDAILADENQRHNRFPSGAPVPEGPGALRSRIRRFRTFGDDITLDDPVVHRLIVRRYTPDHEEAMQLMNDGVDPTNLYLLDEQSVFRHTATRPDYQRFADVRMKSIFELLDMKQLARQKDRVFLLGGISFLVLITQGSDQHKALPAELAHLRANAQTIAQVPILVGDHRLDVKIVTPALDTVLQGEKWDTLDERIAARMLRQFRPKASDKATDKDSAQLAGHWLENERLMLRRTFEKHIFARIVRRNRDLASMPKMRFHPARVALAFDQAWATFMLDLRENREVSRDTMLSQFEFDQEHEARMLEREAKQFDDTFKTRTPFDSPTGRPGIDPTADPGGTSRSQQRRAGRRRGGTRNGGGAAPGSGQGQPPRNPRRLSDGATGPELLEEAKALGIKGRHKMRLAELDEAIADALDALDDEVD